MQHIETVTVGATPEAVIEFTSIPQTFTDLYLLVSLRSDETPNYQDAILKFNGTIVSQRVLYANSTTPASAATSSDNYFSHNAASSNASTFGNAALYIPNYANTSSNKSASSDIVVENNSGSSGAYLLSISAWLYSSNSAVESISFTCRTAGKGFVENSSVALYGILAGSDGVTSVS